MTPEMPLPDNAGNVYEMLWKCDFCGTDKLLGKAQRFCPHCGAPQNPDSRYFPSAAEAVAVQNYRYQGVDVVCSACGTPHAGTADFCGQCGAPLHQAAKVKLKTDAVPLAATPPAKKKYFVVMAIIAVVIFLGAGGFALDYFWRKELVLQLLSVEWRREIRIEQLQALHDSAWCDALPADAYRVSSSSEIRSYRKIPDGESCHSERVDQGDGTFTIRQRCETRYREEPVYDRKCRFIVDRWRYTRSLIAAGNDRKPYYPQLQLPHPGVCLGCEREAQRVAAYFLNLTAVSGKTVPYRCETSESLWRQAEPGSMWRMEIGVLTDTIHCDTLKPKG